MGWVLFALPVLFWKSNVIKQNLFSLISNWGKDLFEVLSKKRKIDGNFYGKIHISKSQQHQVIRINVI
jgi:hypothetical protein